MKAECDFLLASGPPSSFSVIQPGTGVPLKAFWIPVHIAITGVALEVRHART